MPTTTGLTSEQLKKKIDELKSQGKTESTSKSLGKYVQAYKVANPAKYGADQVASAKQNLKLINEPIVSGPGGTTGTPGTPSISGGGELSALEAQLAERQSAINKAMGDINDNPWYSEATRVGKLAKLNQQSQADIANIQNQINQKRQDQQFATQQNAPQLQTITDAAGNVTIYDLKTGKVTSTLKGVGTPQKGSTVIDPEEKAFDAAIADGIAQLQKGENWGIVWNRIHTRFPTVPAILIDAGLGGSGSAGTGWAAGGAYEEFKGKQPASAMEQLIQSIAAGQGK